MSLHLRLYIGTLTYGLHRTSCSNRLLSTGFLITYNPLSRIIYKTLVILNSIFIATYMTWFLILVILYFPAIHLLSLFLNFTITLDSGVPSLDPLNSLILSSYRIFTVIICFSYVQGGGQFSPSIHLCRRVPSQFTEILILLVLVNLLQKMYIRLNDY